MNVLSLFNGMNTGRQALENNNIPVNKYYSSEIKPIAIKLTQFHYPDTIQLGNINNWKSWNIDWNSINIILSGSPCQDLSAAGNRDGINGSKSSLFWVFVEILNHTKKYNPHVLFFQENVGSANKFDVGIMSRAMGLYPQRLNSSLVIAQLRDRYYWSNIKTKPLGMFGDIITDFPIPTDREIMFGDIITDGFVYREKATALLESDHKTFAYKDMAKYKKYIVNRFNKGRQTPNIVYVENDKILVKTNTKQGYTELTENDCLNMAFPTSKTRRGRVAKGKSPCLLASNEPLYTFDTHDIRPVNKIELCRLQGFPDNYCDTISLNQAASLLGDGWTLPMIEHFFSFINY